MQDRSWELGICGTFDVENYGDLLFPLIADLELTERLGSVTLQRFSYYAKSPPEWPYPVTSVTALPGMIGGLNGLLIGGGFLARFDKEVAVGYAPPSPEIHHPTGYWLSPALMALQHNVPVVWNAPGTDGRPLPAWGNPLLGTALDLSRYVAVRDEPSRLALQPLTGSTVNVVPDTAFGLPRLLNLDGPPSEEFQRLCEASGLRSPYIVIHAIAGLEEFVRAIRDHPKLFRDFQFLALPVGPVLGNRSEIIEEALPGAVRLPYWPGPLVLAELMGRAEAAVSQSYHLCITSLTYGVPVFTRHDLSAGKYTALQGFDSIFELPPNGRPDIEWLLARVGRKAPSQAVRATCEPLKEHWDRIARELQAERKPTASGMNRLWQSIPTYMAIERAEPGRVDTEPAIPVAAVAHEPTVEPNAEIQGRPDDTIRQLTMARAEVATRDARIAEILSSLSWRLTAPLRFGGRPFFRGLRVLNARHLRNYKLETYPYSWAAMRNLYSAKNAERLAATYPCDHFKLVSSYDGEKDYEYEVRPLIGMGAKAISYPEELGDTWKDLAMDLLSPEYRAAIAAMTGCDLTGALLEVNVFHYGPGGSMGAHVDMPAKLVTHVLYFNRSWDGAKGGCLRILRSADVEDVVAEVPPLVGCSSVLVRSANSWHAVSRMAADTTASRRAVTVTFYRPGSVSTMWPPNGNAPLHRFYAPDLVAADLT